MLVLKTGTMQPQAKRSWQSPEAEGSKEELLPESSEKARPCLHLGFSPVMLAPY
jgi:hypothetical protein